MANSISTSTNLNPSRNQDIVSQNHRNLTRENQVQLLNSRQPVGYQDESNSEASIPASETEVSEAGVSTNSETVASETGDPTLSDVASNASEHNDSGEPSSGTQQAVLGFIGNVASHVGVAVKQTVFKQATQKASLGTKILLNATGSAIAATFRRNQNNRITNNQRARRDVVPAASQLQRSGSGSIEVNPPNIIDTVVPNVSSVPPIAPIPSVLPALSANSSLPTIELNQQNITEAPSVAAEAPAAEAPRVAAEAPSITEASAAVSPTRIPRAFHRFLLAQGHPDLTEAIKGHSLLKESYSATEPTNLANSGPLPTTIKALSRSGSGNCIINSSNISGSSIKYPDQSTGSNPQNQTSFLDGKMVKYGKYQALKTDEEKREQANLLKERNDRVQSYQLQDLSPETDLSSSSLLMPSAQVALPNPNSTTVSSGSLATVLPSDRLDINTTQPQPSNQNIQSGILPVGSNTTRRWDIKQSIDGMSRANSGELSQPNNNSSLPENGVPESGTGVSRAVSGELPETDNNGSSTANNLGGMDGTGSPNIPETGEGAVRLNLEQLTGQDGGTNPPVNSIVEIDEVPPFKFLPDKVELSMAPGFLQKHFNYHNHQARLGADITLTSACNHFVFKPHLRFNFQVDLAVNDLCHTLKNGQGKHSIYGVTLKKGLQALSLFSKRGITDGRPFSQFHVGFAPNFQKVPVEAVAVFDLKRFAFPYFMANPTRSFTLFTKPLFELPIIGKPVQFQLNGKVAAQFTLKPAVYTDWVVKPLPEVFDSPRILKSLGTIEKLTTQVLNNTEGVSDQQEELGKASKINQMNVIAAILAANRNNDNSNNGIQNLVETSSNKTQNLVEQLTKNSAECCETTHSGLDSLNDKADNAVDFFQNHDNPLELMKSAAVLGVSWQLLVVASRSFLSISIHAAATYAGVWCYASVQRTIIICRKKPNITPNFRAALGMASLILRSVTLVVYILVVVNTIYNIAQNKNFFTLWPCLQGTSLDSNGTLISEEFLAKFKVGSIFSPILIIASFSFTGLFIYGVAPLALACFTGTLTISARNRGIALSGSLIGLYWSRKLYSTILGEYGKEKLAQEVFFEFSSKIINGIKITCVRVFSYGKVGKTSKRIIKNIKSFFFIDSDSEKTLEQSKL